MHKYLLLFLVLISAVAAKSQPVFSAKDSVYTYNSSAPLGSVKNPINPGPGVMAKWIRTPIPSREPWDTAPSSRFKCYLWNGMAFRLRYPENYDSTNPARYPVIIFFHGGGEIGPITQNEDHLFWGAQTFAGLISGGSFNAFLLYPQETSVGWGDAQFQVVNGMLDTLAKYNALDLDKVITMGLSEGGYGAMAMASLYPQRVATVIASSPIDLTTIGNMNAYIHVPMYIANGGEDINPQALKANQYYNQFHDAGGNIFQHYYSTQGHAIWNFQWDARDWANNIYMVLWWNAASKAQPLLFFQTNQFCVGSPISARMGITSGYYAYQWQMSTGSAAFADIPGATGNEFTATQAGSYRVHYMRTATSGWSPYTPSPVKISTKPCSLDTVFVEHFTTNTDSIRVNGVNQPNPTDYQYFAPAQEYKRGRFGTVSGNTYTFQPENGLYINGSEFFSTDATGVPGGRYSGNYTNSASGFSYAATDKVFGLYFNWPTVKPNTNYVFSFYAGNQNTSSLAQLVPNIGGTNLISGSAALPSGVTGNTSWRKFSYIWNSGSNTIADLAIMNKNTNTSGNDFALDEISLTQLLAPGGIGTNMALWTKADQVPLADSSKLFDWANAAGGTTLTQTTVNNKPLLKNNAAENINFNPLVSFNLPNNLFLTGTGGFAGNTSHSAAHIFMVARSIDSVATDSVIVERGGSSSVKVAIGLNMKGNITWDAGSNTGGSHLTAAASYSDLNKPVLWSFSKDNVNGTGSGNKQDIRRNGLVVASSNAASPSFTGNSSNFNMGSSNVKIAEAVYYLDANITSASQNRIESYLATKYGMTLGYKANPTSYTASDGVTIFWPGSTTYQTDVFGIGVDSLSGLNQLQSNSLNSGSGDGTGQSGKGNLILTAVSPLDDKDFLMIGNDSTTLAEHIITSTEAQPAVQGATRIGREWKVRNTGNVGTVTLTFDTTGLTLAGGNKLGNYLLMIDSDGDGDFTTGTTSFYYATSASGKQLNFSGVTFNNNVVFTIITQKVAGSLPATWLGFTAQNVSGNALLNWETSEEINVDYYAVEHSTNGLDFNVIGVKPAYNSLGINDYSYTQQSLSAGMHYYRIRRVDRDGVYKYSDVKALKVSAVNAIQIRPNPVTGSTLTLGISLQQSVPAIIQVVSVDGKVMLRTNTQLTQGVNTVSMNVAAIPTGIYLVQVQTNDDVVTKKFIRAH